MKKEEKIRDLTEFKEILLEWFRTSREKRRVELREHINRKIKWVRQEVIEAKCFSTYTIGPPPFVDGLIYKDVDLFEILFETPYGRSPVANVVDMIDQTIEVLNTSKEVGRNEGAVPAEIGASENIIPIEHGESGDTASTKDEEDEDAPSEIKQGIERGYAFIAMAIDPDNLELEDVLDAIKEGANRCGIQAERVDENQSNRKITDRIIESIRKAEFVIVDLTYPKPNVYYEAGYAEGIGKTPIFISKKNNADIAFDVQDYPIIFFENFRQLKDKLEEKLRYLSESPC